MIRYLNRYAYHFQRFIGSLKRMFGVLKTRDLYSYYKYPIGEYTTGFPEIFPYENSTITIGNYCSFANKVTIFLGHEHHSDWISTYPFGHFGDFQINKNTDGFSKGDVVIGNDVWIGYGVTILSGVTIGDGAVIGACSLVNKNVEPYSIVGGVPAKLIRKRFDSNTIKQLLDLQWWNWPKEKIQRHIEVICSNNFKTLFFHT